MLLTGHPLSVSEATVSQRAASCSPVLVKFCGLKKTNSTIGRKCNVEFSMFLIEKVVENQHWITNVKDQLTDHLKHIALHTQVEGI